MFDKLKELLPNIPDEVIRDWLLPFAEIDGLPSDQNNWDKRKTGEELAFWNDAKWEKINIDLNNIKYSKAHLHSMDQLFKAYLQNDKNTYWESLGEGGKRRFFKCLTYILENKIFPIPPIIVITDKKEYEVVDGNHRFLSYIVADGLYKESLHASPEVLMSMCKDFNIESIKGPSTYQEVWVCTPNWENSPDTKTRRHLLNNGIDIDLFY